MKRLLLFAICIFFCSIQDIIYAHFYKRIGVEDGLSNRRVFSIQQCSEGYMWFLTLDGVDRYDGRDFRHYTLIENGRDEKSKLVTNTLHKDSKGVLWSIGKQGRVFYLDTRIDEFKLACSTPLSKKGNLPTPISYGFIDKQDIIWLCASDSIYQYNIQNKEFSSLTKDFNETITCIEQIDTCHFLIGTDVGIHYAYVKDQKVIQSHCNGLDSLQVYVNDIYYHQSSNKIFFGTLQEGVYVYDRTLKKTNHLNTGLRDVSINRIIYFNEQEILLATDGVGVYKINTHNYGTEPFISADYNSPNIVSGNNIQDIFIDKDYRIWLSNYPYGITLLNKTYPDYKQIKHSLQNEQSLVNDQVNSIIEDSDHDLWFATNNGISHYNVKTKKWESYFSSFNKGKESKGHTFLSLCEVTPGEIWTSGYNSGIYIIHKKTKKHTYFNTCSKSHKNRCDKYIQSIYKDESGNVWIGGLFQLNKYNLQTHTSKNYPGVNNITCIKAQNEDYLWIGTANGLYRFCKNDGFFQRIPLPGSSSYIYTLYQDKKGMLYIGVSGSGLITYNPSTKESIQYHRRNSGLNSNNIYHILSDKEEKLLLSTNKGLCVFYPQKEVFKNWTKDQGLISTHFNPNSGTVLSNGNVIFGSIDGAITFHKDIKLNQPQDYKLIFRDLYLFYKVVHPGIENSPLRTNIDNTEAIYLKHNQNTIAISYSTINFDYPSLALYRWKLEGFYNEWGIPTNIQYVNFTNLSPGTYTLKVRAVSDENANQILDEREIKIIIEQSFWKRPIALVIYLLSLLLIGYIALHLSILRKRRKLSEEKIKFFITTAHDIRTPLTLIKAPLEDLEQNEPLSEEGKSHIYSALRGVNMLLRQATNLINFEKTGHSMIRLSIAPYSLIDFVEEIASSFQDYAKAKKIHITIVNNVDRLLVWLDRERMESILKNIISNALKYSNANGEVTISINQNKKDWSIIIKDNGIGIPPSEQKHLFKTQFRGSNTVNLKVTGTGVGLLLVYKLIHEHKGHISLKSEECKGTSVKIRFPKSESAYAKAIKIEPTSSPKRDTDSNTREPSNIPLGIDAVSMEMEIKEETTLNKDKILIIEDNDELRLYLKRSFKNYYTQVCDNGEDALDIIKEFNPDLVISDIMMPKLRGDKLCEIIKSNMEISHIPVILLTALTNETDIVKGLKLGADEYITKPFSMSVLKAKVESLLENRKRLREKYAKFDPDNDEDLIEHRLNFSNELDWKFIATLNSQILCNMDNPDFNIDKLCALLGMSRTAFYNKIKALTDLAPVDYIRLIRLKRAIQLLKENKYNITEIAEMTGFSDAKYFREIFKRYFKVSPSQYLKQNDKTTDTNNKEF